MSESSPDPVPEADIDRTSVSEGREELSPEGPRAFLNRRPWLFLTLSLATGFGCGALAAFVNRFNPEEIGFLELSVGLYVVPPVILGRLAVRPRPAAVSGSVAYLAAILGHLTTSLPVMDDHDWSEYRAWVFVGLMMGALLGYLGNKFRSRSTSVRVFAAGFPLGLMATFLWIWARTLSESERVVVHPLSALLEGALALLLLVLCRGWTARGVALLCAVALVLPLSLCVAALFMLVWVASGDY